MHSESSIATRLFACLVVAVVVGGASVGVAAGSSSAGSVLSSSTAFTTDSVDGSIGETTERLENTTDSVEDTTTTTTDSVENTSGTTTDAVEDTTDSTTDSLESVTDDSDGSGETSDAVDETTDTVDETTETVDDTVDTTTEAVDTTVDESGETVDETTDGTGDTLERTVDETTIDSTLEAETGLGTRQSSPNGSSDGKTTAENASAASGGDADGASDGTETATDAILVGMLGAITASGAAAGSAGATGTAGGGSAVTAGWLHTLRETRLVRRAGTNLWKVLPLFRYSQYDDSDPLEHDRRRAIYETIEAEPGSYLSQLSEDTGVPLSTIRHHVRILEEEDLITTSKHSGKRRYFLDGADAELQAALAEPAKRDVLEALAELGRVHNGRLADELDRDPSTVSHHLAGLEDDGLVVRERDGRSIVNELPARVRAALGGDSPPAGDAEPAPADD